MRYAVTGPTATKPLHAQHLSDHPGERVASRDPLSAMGAATLVGNNWSPVAHAMTIRRTTGFGSPHPRRWLLGLQRQYGNRYAQRVVALARQASGEAAVDSEVESAIERARGGGQALDSGVRLQMQSAFGADFRDVRAHTDWEADALNRAVNAVAFTTGRDIFFSAGAYNPSTSAGQEFLAHELTHVLQQDHSKVRGKLRVVEPGDQSEQEADRVAKQVVATLQRARSSSRVPNSAKRDGVHRQCACGGHAAGGQCDNCRKKDEAGANMAATAGRDKSGGVVATDTLPGSGQRIPIPEDDPASQALDEPGDDSLWIGQVDGDGGSPDSTTPDNSSPPDAGPTPSAGPGPDAGPGSDTGPSATGATGCTISSATMLHAPDGSADSRTTVGAGEIVTFTTRGKASWSTSAFPLAAAGTASFVWHAPEAAGSTTVTASVGTPAQTCSITINTMAPASISMTKASEDPIPAGTAGAGMLLNATINPLNVSFGNTQWLEVPGDASNVSGYFAAKQAKGADLSHHPNRNFVGIDSQNEADDHAALTGMRPPFSAGGFQYNIPNNYRVKGGGSAGGNFFTTTVESFTIAPDGTVTVSKQEASVSRHP